jgi:acetyl esterase/lipase
MTDHLPTRRGIVGGLITAGLVGGLTTTHAQDKPAEGRVEKNVVYAMYSGLALLMDVYHPAKPNGYGIIWINGSGWRAPPGHSDFSLKDSPNGQRQVKPLRDAGYTVFVINHRGIPEFKYPAGQEDAQRAVRFVRANAKKYGIRPDRIGATGGSSGGELALMLGVLDGAGVPDAPDPVARESAKVQCVVAWMAPSDFLNGYGDQPPRAGYIGTLPGRSSDSPETKLYREASPVTHVTRDDPPTLLVHGDADTTVPFKHSELMEAALKKAGVPVKLVRLPGGGHGPAFYRAQKDWPDFQAETVRWFDQHLQKK